VCDGVDGNPRRWRKKRETNQTGGDRDIGRRAGTTTGRRSRRSAWAILDPASISHRRNMFPPVLFQEDHGVHCT
jgi:hypothetical protein